MTSYCISEDVASSTASPLLGSCTSGRLFRWIPPDSYSLFCSTTSHSPHCVDFHPRNF